MAIVAAITLIAATRSVGAKGAPTLVQILSGAPINRLRMTTAILVHAGERSTCNPYLKRIVQRDCTITGSFNYSNSGTPQAWLPPVLIELSLHCCYDVIIIILNNE